MSTYGVGYANVMLCMPGPNGNGVGNEREP